MRRLPRLLFIGTFLLALVASSTLWLQKPTRLPIRSDGLGYYIYLPSLFIFGDPSFESMSKVLRRYHYTATEEIPYFSGVRRYPLTGRYLDKYPIGVAVLQAPFFLMGHVAAKLSGAASDGSSWPYQCAVLVAAAFYLALGLALLFETLSRTFSTNISIVALGCILFGTPLFHYSSYDACFSHVYSFFLHSAFLLLLDDWTRDRRLRDAISLGIVFGLVVLVRPSNIVLGIIAIPTLGPLMRDKQRGFIAAISAFLLVCLPQLLAWKAATGSYLTYAYEGEGFCFLSPQIIGTLFDGEVGLLLWSPVLVFAIAGIALMQRRSVCNRSETIAYCMAHLFIVSSWCTWKYGRGFGHRAFVESGAIIVFPLAAFLSWLIQQRFRRVGSGAVAVSVLFTLLLTLQYWRGGIPSSGIGPELWAQLTKPAPSVQILLEVGENCRGRRVSRGESCVFHVMLQTTDGLPLAGQTVWFESRRLALDAWTPFQSKVTDEMGQAEFSQLVKATTRFAALVDDSAEPIRSNSLRVSVQHKGR